MSHMNRVMEDEVFSRLYNADKKRSISVTSSGIKFHIEPDRDYYSSEYDTLSFYPNWARSPTSDYGL